jgi:hypothetical protein
MLFYLEPFCLYPKLRVLLPASWLSEQRCLRTYILEVTICLDMDSFPPFLSCHKSKSKSDSDSAQVMNNVNVDLPIEW